MSMRVTKIDEIKVGLYSCLLRNGTKPRRERTPCIWSAFFLNMLFPMPLDITAIFPKEDKFRNDFPNIHCNNSLHNKRCLFQLNFLLMTPSLLAQSFWLSVAGCTVRVPAGISSVVNDVCSVLPKSLQIRIVSGTPTILTEVFGCVPGYLWVNAGI
jgi:hypothetical protein